MTQPPSLLVSVLEIFPLLSRSSLFVAFLVSSVSKVCIERCQMKLAGDVARWFVFLRILATFFLWLIFFYPADHS
ncbi:MAG: hypothetical protein MJE68_18590 [Proteobacteria bacterium]|nr:hypothetical protein [Pseudomonadota bacterium]